MNVKQYSAILRYLGRIEGLAQGVEDENIQAALIMNVDRIYELLTEVTKP